MRYLTNIINQFSENKFVLIMGPRQVGKTTLARSLLPHNGGLYLNYDDTEHKKTILNKSYLNDENINFVILDEIHKYSRWKQYVKSLYDLYHERLKVLVTGSARLDTYKRGGDSLFGRYESVRLHPFCVTEIIHGQLSSPPKDWLDCNTRQPQAYQIWQDLEKFGGFPEPYLAKNPQQYNRWNKRRQELLLRQDIRDLSMIKDLSLVEHLYFILPSRIGSPLSINSLKTEIGVAFDTVKSWVLLLEKLYMCYRISPYSHKISRSLKKEQKLYLWNWRECESEATLFENMVASHLLKSIDFWNDCGFGDFKLSYYRDKEKYEVDFIVTNKSKPLVAIECKLTDTSPSDGLFRFENNLGYKIPKIQLVKEPKILWKKADTLVCTAADYFAAVFK